MRRLDRGGLPEAIRHDGSWTVPTEALMTIAEREGWPMDLDDTIAVDETPRLSNGPDHMKRYLDETMAAHAAVVLAKTQAAAARAEARDLAGRVQSWHRDLELERAEHGRTAIALSTAEKAQAILERDRAVAEARADELRQQIKQERAERSLLVSRIGILEAEREEAIASMDWLSKKRYTKGRAQSKPPPAPSTNSQNVGRQTFRLSGD